MDIEKRLTNLENLVYSFIKNQGRADDYKTADIAGCRQTEITNAINIEANTENINISSDTLDTVMEVVIPTQAEALDEMAETLDTLMSTVIPELMGE